MGHDHSPSLPRGASRASVRYKSKLRWAFFLTLSYFFIEVVAGFATNSLALLSDAGHMLTDVIGLGMALAAIRLASRGSDDPQRTFGFYRLEILAALANGVMLFGVAGYVLFEAYRRLSEPPEVIGLPMLIVAVVGLFINLIAFILLRQGAKESLNVAGAYLEVLSDAVGSVGVIVAAVVLQLTGWRYVDPIVGAGIGLFILPRTYRLSRKAIRILIQAAPPEIDLGSVESDLKSIEGVVDVHDLHLWTLTSDMEVATAHLLVAEEVETQVVLDRARDILKKKYSVVHATLQIESQSRGCEELGW